VESGVKYQGCLVLRRFLYPSVARKPLFSLFYEERVAAGHWVHLSYLQSEGPVGEFLRRRGRSDIDA
jgi:hypothetical protein